MASAPCAGTEPALNFHQVIRRIEEISSLPQVAMRVMQVANQTTAGAGDLKGVLEHDPALCARVLRCVNSSAYATRVKITNLQQAIAYLGIRQIRNLALTASVSNLFKQPGGLGSYNRTSLWRHLVAVGICARMIAMRHRVSAFEDTFLAGLLHDVGIILEDQHVHDAFACMVGSLAEGTTLREAESRHLGFDHTTLAEAVTKNWSFPQTVTDAVRFHHASAAYQGPHLQVVRFVEVANFICSVKGIPSVGINLVQFPRDAIGGLSLTKEDIVVLATDLDREMSANESLFQL
jgi:HD-like signal output (HDOD) protein